MNKYTYMFLVGATMICSTLSYACEEVAEDRFVGSEKSGACAQSSDF